MVTAFTLLVMGFFALMAITPLLAEDEANRGTSNQPFRADRGVTTLTTSGEPIDRAAA